MQIYSYFTEKLLRIVEDILRHTKGKSKAGSAEPTIHGFPQLAGTNIHMGDAALEFIKHVCAVLALDQNIQHDVLVKLIILNFLSIVNKCFS